MKEKTTRAKEKLPQSTAADPKQNAAKNYIEEHFPQMLTILKEGDVTGYIEQLLETTPEMLFYKSEIITYCYDRKVPKKRDRETKTIHSADPSVVLLLRSLTKRVPQGSEVIEVGVKRKREDLADGTPGELASSSGASASSSGASASSSGASASSSGALVVSPEVFVVSDDDLDDFLKDLDSKLKKLNSRRESICAEMARRDASDCKIVSEKIIEVLSRK